MLCAALLLYDKLSSLSPSNMFDRSVTHVRGTNFGCIRTIVPDIRTIVLGTWLIVPGTQPIVLGTRTIVSGTDPEFTGCINLVPLD
jgi:hypothetical protein